MAAFQGNEPSGLSPFLMSTLQQGEERAHSQSARAVAELSRLFTKDRDALGADYLNDPVLADGYLSYFLPVNVSKIQVLLDELPADWHCRHRSIRVLDMGTGPGTGAIAVLDWLNRRDDHALMDLTVVGVDASAAALRQARRLWTAYSRYTRMARADLVLHEGDVGRAKNDWRENVAQRGPYDLIIVANCLNEFFRRSHESILDKSRLIAELLAVLAPHGSLMIVEPALRETSRALHQVRDLLLQERQCTVYSPCLHENNCPALIHEDDWCHEERAWVPPRWVQDIDREVGFIKDALKFSYLLLRTDGRTIAERSPNTFRMVSELRKLKGDVRAWLCNERGRSEVGRLDRASSAANAAWDHCQRGTIVRIEGLTRKEAATLARIPAEGPVQIVRRV